MNPQNESTKESMSKYEQLKKVIQEANPEIMELKFGCEVELGVMSGYIIVSGPSDQGWSKGQYWITRNNPDELRHAGSTATKKEMSKILGRPIRLADVLLAISGKKLISISEQGQFLDDENSEKRFTKIYWNLFNDSLDNQSDETKQFLIDLLV